MLILVAVTVSYSIKSGLLTKAQEGGAKEQKEQERETLMAAVSTVYDTLTGTINVTELEKELKKSGEWEVSGSSAPYTVKSPNNIFIVDENGKITDAKNNDTGDAEILSKGILLRYDEKSNTITYYASKELENAEETLGNIKVSAELDDDGNEMYLKNSFESENPEYKYISNTPTEILDSDVYYMNNEYIYYYYIDDEKEYNGWILETVNKTATTYSEIPATIYGKPIELIDFANCTNVEDLSNITIPETCKTLQGTFAECTSLKKAPIIHNAVTEIIYCFDHCDNLHEIEYAGTAEEFNKLNTYHLGEGLIKVYCLGSDPAEIVEVDINY